MKKNVLLLVALLFSLMLSAADDVIILKNSTRIDAKIEEITNTELHYKKVNNLEGPLYITKLSEVSIVILANGDVISYANYQPQATFQTAGVAKRQKVSNQSNDTTRRSSVLKFNPEPSDKRTFGLSIGYNSKQIVEDDNHASFLRENSYERCFQLSWIAQPEFKYGIGIKTGLTFEIGHEKYGYSLNQTQMIDLSFSFPVQLSYRYEIINGLSVLLYTGPVFDFGAYLAEAKGAKPYSKSRNYYSGGLFSRSGYDGFNCLWGIGAGVQYHGLRLSIGGEFGMVNKTKSKIYPAEINKPFMISLAYMFNNKNK